MSISLIYFILHYINQKIWGLFSKCIYTVVKDRILLFFFTEEQYFIIFYTTFSLSSLLLRDIWDDCIDLCIMYRTADMKIQLTFSSSDFISLVNFEEGDGQVIWYNVDMRNLHSCASLHFHQQCTLFSEYVLFAFLNDNHSHWGMMKPHCKFFTSNKKRDLGIVL